MSLKAYKLLFPGVWLVKQTKKLSAVSCRLTQLTGKSKYPIHPKHLLSAKKLWFMDNISKKDVVLDLGCGNGQQTLKTAPRCKQIIGLDYDKRQLDIARRISIDKKITGTLIIMSMLIIAFGGEIFLNYFEIEEQHYSIGLICGTILNMIIIILDRITLKRK